MAGGGPVGGVRDNADSLRPFSGAWRVVAAQTIALGPRTGPPPRPLARGRSITSLTEETSNVGIAIGESKPLGTGA
jgi:hypothetical protein